MRKFMAIAVLVLAAFIDQQSGGAFAADIPWKNETVSLEVDPQSEDPITYKDIPWTLNMTALDAMKMAGDLKFTAEWYRSQAGWLVTSINGKQSEGAQKANWLLCVNGYTAGVGPGAYPLQPGAKVRWVFDKQFPPKGCQ